MSNFVSNPYRSIKVSNIKRLNEASFLQCSSESLNVMYMNHDTQIVDIVNMIELELETKEEREDV